MRRLTGTTCLNVESSGEDRAPNQPDDLHCVASAATKHLYPSLDAACPRTERWTQQKPEEAEA